MDIFEVVKGTYATVGQEMTDTQLALVVTDLAPYPLAEVLAALGRCRRELRRIALVDILDRIPGGHPGVEESWAMVGPILRDESRSLIWTDEMREAFGVARGLADDPIAARMAFKEKYTALVNLARAERRPPIWSVSLGTDKAQRAAALHDAVQKNRISIAHANRLLPPGHEDLPLVGPFATLLQVGHDMPPEETASCSAPNAIP